ncbi:hypothetical protein B0A50_05091 [Salinomyces thailandicus]|uniref:Diphthamide biosynthesis protein 4 n=1 Tax=Salinomyces thailandicus TaxID=706561 RepID=A0A4U0TW95_9PEZI|nr:hypothetical protein B0A50_05091 [Salinomyces thailandica]
MPDYNYYEVLNLAPRPLDETLTAQDVKHAYRQALLSHHPDKAGHDTGVRNGRDKATTVDHITLAYKTLVDAQLRAEYDRALVVSEAKDQKPDRVHQTGLETVDLDSLQFSDESETWTRSCRCGDPKGFVVSEPELEKCAEEGELTLGCRGCSLWLRVLFSVED